MEQFAQCWLLLDCSKNALLRHKVNAAVKTVNFIAYIMRQVETVVKRCVAMNCFKTYQDGVSLYGFPQDPSLQLEWTRQVQRTLVSCSQMAIF